MMPHEYEKEIRALKEDMKENSKIIYHLVVLEERQRYINDSLKDCVELIEDEIKKLKDIHKQTDQQPSPEPEDHKVKKAKK